MFSLRNCLPSRSIALWGGFIASLIMTLIVSGADGIKESIGGLSLQFIGTIVCETSSLGLVDFGWTTRVLSARKFISVALPWLR
jgi:hypothetical protein